MSFKMEQKKIDELINDFSITKLRNLFKSPYDNIFTSAEGKTIYGDILKKLGSFNGCSKEINDERIYLFTNPEYVGWIDSTNVFIFLIHINKDYDTVNSLQERNYRRAQYDYANFFVGEVRKNEFRSSFTKNNDMNHFIFVFVDDSSKNFRFSLIDVPENEYNKKFKRSSFYVSKENTNTTFINHLLNCDWSSWDGENGIKNTFSVEKLNNDFFKEYKVFYEDFVQYITGHRYIKKGNNYTLTKVHDPKPNPNSEPNSEPMFNQFIQIAQKNNVDKNEKEITEIARKYVRDYVKKMMGRAVFMQFLQKKGWLSPKLDNTEYGLKNIFEKLLEKLPEKDSKKLQKSFLSQYLEPIFFGILNTDEKNRVNLFEEKGWSKDVLSGMPNVPYLNGGLFEQDELFKGIVVDFPKEMFVNEKKFEAERLFILPQENKDYDYTESCGLFDFFNRYNFTIDENKSSDDVEIGIDPEMLGRIFENLLEDNKDKGAFYTPKLVVDYMCKEALIAYLEKDFKKKKEEIRNLVEYEDFNLSKDECKSLVTKLEKVKICDPAIGSGAFPMGMLDLLVDVRYKLGKHKNLKRSKECSLKFKKYFLQNSIYGVDIEAGAVDIARLRFWLSLIIEADTPELLPNLDYKIMQGNSLVESFEGIDLSFDGEIPISKKKGSNNVNIQPSMIDEKQNLFSNITSFFDNHDKKSTSTRIDSDIKNIILNKIKEIEQTETQKTQINLEQIEEKVKNLKAINDQFFLWHLYFHDVFANGGFDIVIGNPPYIQLQYMSQDIKKIYENEEFETYDAMGDIYCLFYEKSISFLKNKGVLSFITSNKWMKVEYGKKLRKFLVKSNPRLLIDLGSGVFENAEVDTNIILVKKEKYCNKTLACSFENRKQQLAEIYDYVKQNACFFYFTQNKWVITENNIEDKIISKIKQYGKPLEDCNIKIRRGITTGYNKAFIIKSQIRDELIKEDAKSADVIKPILRGKDIKMYGYDFADLYIIAFFPSKHYDIDDYPAIKKRLKSFGKKLEQTGETYIDGNGVRQKCRKKTNNKWFEMQDNIAFWREFSKQKLVMTRIGSKKIFSFVEENIYILDSLHFITSEYINLKALCYVLNSKLFQWFLSKNIGSAVGGNAGNQDNFKNLQIIDPKKQDIWDKIIKFAKNNEKDEIEDIIFDYFKLNENEKVYVKNEISSENLTEESISNNVVVKSEDTEDKDDDD